MTIVPQYITNPLGGTEKRKSFLRSLFWSGQTMYLWFGARYGFDGLTLLGYTSTHAAANAVGLMRQQKMGKFVRAFSYRLED